MSSETLSDIFYGRVISKFNNNLSIDFTLKLPFHFISELNARFYWFLEHLKSITNINYMQTNNINKDKLI